MLSQVSATDQFKGSRRRRVGSPGAGPLAIVGAVECRPGGPAYLHRLGDFAQYQSCVRERESPLKTGPRRHKREQPDRLNIAALMAPTSKP